MKYICKRCQYSTNDKSNFNKHLKRKRKCVPKKVQKVPENCQMEIHRDTQIINLEIQRDTQNNNNVNDSNTWSCYFCLKTFTTNCSMNRHMRLYCKIKKYHRNRIKALEEQNRRLQFENYQLQLKLKLLQEQDES